MNRLALLALLLSAPALAWPQPVKRVAPPRTTPKPKPTKPPPAPPQVPRPQAPQRDDVLTLPQPPR